MTRRRLVPIAVAVVAAVVMLVVFAVQVAGERTAVGIVVDVEGASLTDVRAFTLRGSDGVEITYRVGRLDNPTEFPPSHLSEHRATAEPVRVFYREESGERVAYRLEDAAGG